MIWKKTETKKEILYAPLKGKYIPLEKIPDPVFAEGIMGAGCGIQPEDGVLVSPAAGKIVSVAETGHAVGIVTEDGAEILLHIGIDTVEMGGRGFEVKVSEGEQVTCGQRLLEFDLGKIREAGFSDVTAFIITNSDVYSDVVFKTGTEFQISEECGVLER